MAIFNTADILLPKDTDLTKWSVVACDQYTSQPEYWEKAEKIVGNSPSTLNLIFPEAYLLQGDERIAKINAKMSEYLEKNLFCEHKNSLIYIERTIGNRVRKGLIGAVDLEAYDYKKGSKSAIRATEGTVLERIPPRVKIRKNAPLELPHIMLLCDDTNNTIIEPLEFAEKTKLYDFELMQNGGHLAGWELSPDAVKSTLSAIDTLYESAPDGLLFAVGDGNHSLATAKACWDECKKNLSPKDAETHPARFCLVELENIHSPALEFEPIHRVVFNCEPNALVEKLKSDCGGNDFYIECVIGTQKEKIGLSAEKSQLAVGVVQGFLDDVGAEVDYIHGEDVVLDLAKNENTLGILLPKPEKSALFASVIADGALPRKTFSMGEANEKRFYMEAKRIK